MSETPGVIGDRYELGRVLGHGGMSVVHEARDRVLHRSVAVKLLRQVTHVDRERFAAEASHLARLQHPNVVALLDAGVSDDVPWLALELVAGHTLGQLMSAGPLPPDQAARVGADVAAGLAHAHERGVVHRDVKPGNVLLDDRGRAKLTDFGIARLTDASTGLTLTGHTVGTAAFLSPEQVRGERVTPATDVYALGLVLLEAMTGQRSYPGTPVEAAVARLHRSPLVPTSLPAPWPRLVAAMTAEDPADRPTAAQVHEELATGRPVVAPVVERTVTTDLGSHSSLHPSVHPGIPAGAAAAGRPHRRRRRLVLAAAVAVGALTAAGLVTEGLSGDDPATAAPAAGSFGDKRGTRGEGSVRATPREATPEPTVTAADVEPSDTTRRTDRKTQKAKKARSGATSPKAKKDRAKKGKAKKRGKAGPPGRAHGQQQGKGNKAKGGQGKGGGKGKGRGR